MARIPVGAHCQWIPSTLEKADVREHENPGIDANGEAISGLNHEGESTDAMLGGELADSSDEVE